MNTDPHATPTNGRPRPHDRVMLKRTGAVGTVCEYETSWDSALFPIKLDWAVDERIVSVHDVTVIDSPVVTWPHRTAGNSDTKADSNDGTRTGTSTRRARTRDEGVA